MKDYTNHEIIDLIDTHIHSERDRSLLKRRYVDGIHQEPLAEEFKLSVRQVQNIIYRFQRKVLTRL